MIYLGNIHDILIYYSKLIFSDILISPKIYRIYRDISIYHAIYHQYDISRYIIS